MSLGSACSLRALWSAQCALLRYRLVLVLIVCPSFACAYSMWTIDCYDMFPDVGTLRQMNTWERLFIGEQSQPTPVFRHFDALFASN